MSRAVCSLLFLLPCPPLYFKSASQLIQREAESRINRRIKLHSVRGEARVCLFYTVVDRNRNRKRIAGNFEARPTSIRTEIEPPSLFSSTEGRYLVSSFPFYTLPYVAIVTSWEPPPVAERITGDERGKVTSYGNYEGYILSRCGRLTLAVQRRSGTQRAVSRKTVWAV